MFTLVHENVIEILTDFRLLVISFTIIVHWLGSLLYISTIKSISIAWNFHWLTLTVKIAKILFSGYYHDVQCAMLNFTVKLLVDWTCKSLSCYLTTSRPCERWWSKITNSSNNKVCQLDKPNTVQIQSTIQAMHFHPSLDVHLHK